MEKKKVVRNFEKQWNGLFKKLLVVRKEWRELQEDLNELSWQELEQEYSAAAQGMLTKFRNVRFDLVVPLWVDYWRGRGGLESMLIPPEAVEEAPPLEVYEEEKEEKEETNSLDQMAAALMNRAKETK